MNAVLQEMAREREARKAPGNTQAAEGAAAGAGFVGAGQGSSGKEGITASPGRTEESKRKKKGAPKRRPQPGEGGAAQVGGDQQERSGGAGGGGIDFGAMLEEAAPKPRKKPQRKAPEGGEEGVEAGGAKTKKKTKPRKELEGEFGGGEEEGFDAAELAAVTNPSLCLGRFGPTNLVAGPSPLQIDDF